MEVSSVLVGPRALGSEARAGLSGEDPARGRAAILLFSGLVAIAFGLSCGLGMAAYRVQSARVATLVATLCAVALTLASAPLVPEILRVTAKRAAAAPESERSSGVPLFARVVCAVGFAAIQDGIVALTATFKAHVPLAASLGAGLEAACLIALPLLALLAPAAFVLSRPSSALLGHHVAEGLSARRREGAAFAIVLYGALTALGAVVCWQLAFRFSETHSVPSAVLVAAGAAVGWTLAAALVVASIAPMLASLGRPLARLPLPAWLPVRDLILAAVGVAALHAILPSSHAVTPGAAVVGFAVGPLVAAQVPEMRRIGKADLLTLVGVAAVATGLALALFTRLPDVVRTAVIGRAPYASLVATALVHPSDKVDPSRPTTPFTPPAQVAARDADAPPMRDNVILIHIEALRPDHVGFIGYKRPTTPNLDRFREGATWFKNAYSPAPTTRFALSMLFTGHEIERIPQARGHAVDFTLLPGADTLAERLTPLGYDRVGYTLSYVMQHIKGLGQGFRVWQTPWDVNDWERAYQNSAEQTTNAALSYLSTVLADGSKPYFLFLHYMSTHDPYIKHDKWDYGNDEIDKYDSALNYEDDQIGRLLSALDARADKDKTAIVLYSDHGELFGEHGYKRHGFTLYQPDIHVVLLVRVPGATGVRTIDTPMLLNDVTPTIAELMGLPPDKECQSWDLLPYLRGTPMPARALYLYSDQWRMGVHYVSRGVIEPDGHTKLIHNVSARTEELYDLASDPDELHNLADTEADRVQEMAARVNGWDDYENREHKSFETSNRENADKQAHISRPVFQ